MQTPSEANPETNVARRNRLGSLALALLLITAAAACGAWLVSWIRAQQLIAKEMQLQGRFGQLRLAFQNYHAVHNNFPPYYAKGAAPVSAQSWRVDLLSSMDLDDVHAQYAAAEPWDSAANQRLATSLGEAPAFIRSPFSGNQSSQFADFVLVPLERLAQVANSGTHVCVIDAGDDMIAIAEQQDSTIHWMDPNGN
jgi:hypothetical protein